MRCGRFRSDKVGVVIALNLNIINFKIITATVNETVNRKTEWTDKQNKSIKLLEFIKSEEMNQDIRDKEPELKDLQEVDKI